MSQPESPLYPLKLEPSLHPKVWGGRRLAALLNKALPDEQPYGESWELHGGSRVVNGALRGRSLDQLAQHYGAQLLGAGKEPEDGFPLLAKFIDANDWLSIQVHPNDAQALELEGERRGKTEAWVVLAAEAGAQLVIGVKPGSSREMLAEAIERSQLEALLEYAEVEAGDTLYMPANTIHALGPGILIYEIQQSSDITYRLYDWGRLGLDGAPRELHIDKGLRVADLDARPRVGQPAGALLFDAPYFRAWRHELKDERLRIATRDRFQALTCIAGSLRLEANECEPVWLELGETCLAPACIGAFDMRGSGKILRTSQSAPR